MAEVAKSPRDARSYAWTRLANDLSCLLVSDPDTDFSAAAMSVACGSMCDPADVPGLSHFLEHMLFLGTEKYPEEHTYRSFLKARSGNFNAFTALEETNYYFTVAQDSFRAALDIFAQFFICPLFTPSSVDREMHAVDSEHQKNRNSDLSRMNQLVYASADPAHPYHHFPTGSIRTLQLDTIRERLIAHYQSHYSANVMKLVLYGKEAVEVLKAWADELFAAVPNNKLSPPASDIPPFPSTALGSLTKVVSVVDKRELRLLWELPPMQCNYRCKPYSYVCHLLGHEGEHSILSLLKKKGYCSGFSAGLRTNLKQFSILMVTASLTENGFRNYEEVLETIFTYITKIRSSGPQHWLSAELQQMAEIEFRFKSKENALQYAHTLASSLQKHPPADVITALNLVPEYAPDAIADVLQRLTPERTMIYVIAKEGETEEFLKEKWYQTSYLTHRIPPELLSRLQAPSIGDTELDFPPRNPFLPSDFSLLPSSADVTPQLVCDRPGYSVRHLLDTSFQKDSVSLLLYLKCTDCDYCHTPTSFVLAKLWLKMLQDDICEMVYMASQAGFSMELCLELLGVSACVSGFSQHFQFFVKSAIEKIASFKIRPENERKFAEHFEELERSLRNTRFQQPHVTAKSYFSDVVSANLHHTVAAQLRALSAIDFSDLLRFSQKWLRKLQLDWLFVGNVSGTTAVETAEHCSQTFTQLAGSSTISDADLPPRLCFSIENQSENCNFVYETQLEDEKNANSASLCYWESGKETVEAKAALMVIENIFKEPCFSYLRTQLQLGYIVTSSNQSTRSVLGHSIVVQSHRFPPRKLTAYIQLFIEKMAEVVANLTDEDFALHKNSAVAAVLQKDVSLEKRFQRFASEMLSCRYDFHHRARLALAFQSMTKGDVQSVFRTVFQRPSARLDIEIVSKSMASHQQEQPANSHCVYATAWEIQRQLSLHAADPVD